MKKDLCQGTKKKELGASLVEYGLLVALIAVIAIPSVNILGARINSKFHLTSQTLGAGDWTCNPFVESC